MKRTKNTKQDEKDEQDENDMDWHVDIHCMQHVAEVVYACRLRGGLPLGSKFRVRGQTVSGFVEGVWSRQCSYMNRNFLCPVQIQTGCLTSSELVIGVGPIQRRLNWTIRDLIDDACTQ